MVLSILEYGVFLVLMTLVRGFIEDTSDLMTRLGYEQTTYHCPNDYSSVLIS
jgi:hypothetical protein